ncbi:MAG: preprotein translocase subunit SecG [Candidatus Paceibacterota bacterium]|jgi:protein translocase SecG subunit
MTTIVKLLPYIQIGLSIILIVSILLQQTGSGMGGVLGGGDSNTTYYTRRGFEKILFYLTIIIAILFALSALLAIIK